MVLILISIRVKFLNYGFAIQSDITSPPLKCWMCFIAPTYRLSSFLRCLTSEPVSTRRGNGRWQNSDAMQAKFQICCIIISTNRSTSHCIFIIPPDESISRSHNCLCWIGLSPGQPATSGYRLLPRRPGELAEADLFKLSLKFAQKVDYTAAKGFASMLKDFEQRGQQVDKIVTF